MKRTAIFLLFLAACSKPDAAPAPPSNRAEALVAAVRAGDTVEVAKMLSTGISPDSQAPDGTRPLTEAARNGRVAVARILLAADAKVDIKDSVGNSAWDYAIAVGRAQVAALLTYEAAQVAGASPKANEWFEAVAANTTPMPPWDKVLDGELQSLGLLYAVLCNRVDVVSSLRKSGGIPNRTGITPLAMAARFGSIPAVVTLLEAGADPNLAIGDRWKSTPLMEAARDGHIEIGRALIKAGARIDRLDVAGGTALHWAVRAGETKYARILLEAGADPSIKEWASGTALDLARELGHADLIELLEGSSGRRRQ